MKKEEIKMSRQVDQIKNICSKPIQPVADFLEELLRTDYYRNDFRFDGKITLSPTVSDEDWTAEFIPWPLLDAFENYQSLYKLAAEVDEREGDSEQIRAMAYNYMLKYESLGDYYSKFNYKNVKSCMFLYGGAISEKKPMIFEARPSTVMNILGLKYS